MLPPPSNVAPACLRTLSPHTGPFTLPRPFLRVFVVQWLSLVRLFVTPWTAARQASLSFTISWSLLKLMSTETLMLSKHLCPPLLPPAFNFSQDQGTFGSCICFPGGSDGKESACNEGDPGLIPGSGRSLEKERVTHCSILAWRIP